MKQVLSFVLMISLICTSCKKDMVESNDEEVITTVIVTFTPVGGGSTLTYKFDDRDGPGGQEPLIDEILLMPFTSYDVTLQLLNNTVTPATDITLEIMDESAAHRFYFEPSTESNISVSDVDNDINGLPLGITSTWKTASASEGKITLTLRHYPGIPPNKSFGDLVSSNKSNTDISVEFVTKI